MGRREVYEGRGGVEDEVENRLADELGRDWVGAVSCYPEVVELGWEVGELKKRGDCRRRWW